MWTVFWTFLNPLPPNVDQLTPITWTIFRNFCHYFCFYGFGFTIFFFAIFQILRDFTIFFAIYLHALVIALIFYFQPTVVDDEDKLPIIEAVEAENDDAANKNCPTFCTQEWRPVCGNDGKNIHLSKTFFDIIRLCRC